MKSEGKRDIREMSGQVGRMFADARRDRGLTQNQLANMSSLQQAFVSRLENGRTNPTLKTIVELADIMDYEARVVLVSRETGATFSAGTDDEES